MKYLVSPALMADIDHDDQATVVLFAKFLCAPQVMAVVTEDKAQAGLGVGYGGLGIDSAVTKGMVTTWSLEDRFVLRDYILKDVIPELLCEPTANKSPLFTDAETFDKVSTGARVSPAALRFYSARNGKQVLRKCTTAYALHLDSNGVTFDCSDQ